MTFLLFIIFLPLIFIVLLLIKNWRLVRMIFKINQTQKTYQRQYQQEQERKAKVKKRIQPEQDSVELINEAQLDLEGGEYVDYEEIN